MKSTKYSNISNLEIRSNISQMNIAQNIHAYIEFKIHQYIK